MDGSESMAELVEDGLTDNVVRALRGQPAEAERGLVGNHSLGVGTDVRPASDTEEVLRVFEAAEEGGWILLFDEADSLFGKRSDVRDGRDRFANIDVAFLLQRIEAFPGLVIIATNHGDDIDPAFTRRLEHIVRFPPRDLPDGLIGRRRPPAQ